jgi:hypothetical protein
LSTATLHVTIAGNNPSFTAGGPVSVLEDSGGYSAVWATDISTVDRPFTVSCTTSPADLFAAAASPQVDQSGSLTFTPADNMFGSASCTVTLHGTDGLKATDLLAIEVTGGKLIMNMPDGYELLQVYLSQ